MLRDDFRLTGFENEGYKRKCSLTSEFVSKALRESISSMDESKSISKTCRIQTV